MAKRHGYKRMLREIRPFTRGFSARDGFDLRLSDENLSGELTPAQKAKITRYWKGIVQLSGKPHVVYKSRSKRKLEAVQKASQQESVGLPDLKAAFVPVADARVPTEIDVDERGRVHVRQMGIERSSAFFNKRKLVSDVKSEVARILDDHPARRYTIMAGDREALLYGSFSADVNGIASMIERIMNEYSNKGANNHWKNWLLGLNAYDYDRQSSYSDYVRAKRAEKQRVGKLKRKARISKRARKTGRA